MAEVGYEIDFKSNATPVYKEILKGNEAATKGIDNLTKSATKAWEKLLTFNQAAQAIESVGRALDGLNAPGIALNSNMADLQAITGLAGEGLKEIEKAARDASKAFGTSASDNVESYKLLLSQLSPELGKNATALRAMGDNVNILSKTMGGDTVAATNVLTTALNQYGVSMDDPIAASKTMADFMNIMAAAAREGSAELPQIQQALSQAGMMAKTVGVSFSETNAAIQVLDKAGRKGAEGGVALRNVLSSLAKGRFLPKQVQEELSAAGININRITDQTIPLADRLRAIGPVFNDTALMSKLFGRENVASAIALAGQTEELGRLDAAIKGTDTAVEQSEVIMDSYAERIKRQTAWFDDLKTSIFQATQPIMPFLTGLTSVAGAVAQAGFAINGFNAISKVFVGWKWSGIIANAIEAAAIKRNTIETNRNTGAKGFGTIANTAYAIGMGVVAGATSVATVAIKAFSKAIYSIPIIGWVLAIISAIIAIIIALVKLHKWIWDNSRELRGALYAHFGAVKAIIINIGVFFQRLWTGVIEPVFNLIAGIAATVWKAIAAHFIMIRNTVVSVFKVVVGAVVSAWEAVRDFFMGIWNWISNLFATIGGFLDEWVVKPFVEAFLKVWNFVVNLFSKIGEFIVKAFGPVIDVVKYLFGGNDYKNVVDAAAEGYQQGLENFDAEKERKAAKKKEETGVIPSFHEPEGIAPTTEDPKEEGKNTAVIPLGGGSGGGSRNITLNINKLIETMQLHVTNLKEGKEQIKQAVAEALLTAVNDVNLIS